MRTPALSAVAVAAPLAVCGILVPFRGAVASTNAALVLVLVVLAVAATGNRLAGVVAVSSALWFDLLLTAPYGQFAIASRDDVETAVLLTITGLAVTELALRGRRQQSRSSRREGHLAATDCRP